jgi:hypothetical protein
MRITWSTVLCAAAAFVLLLSGDEPGDGAPSGPHLSGVAVQVDVYAVIARAHPKYGNESMYGTMSIGIAVASTGSGRRLSPDCFTGFNNYRSIPGSAGNYAAVVRGLTRDGWYPFRRITGHGYLNTRLSKGGWDLTVSRSTASGNPDLNPITFLASDTTC